MLSFDMTPSFLERHELPCLACACLKECAAVLQAPNATKVKITLAPNQSDSTVLVGKNPVPSKGGVWSPAEVWVPKRALPNHPGWPRNGRVTAVYERAGCR